MNKISILRKILIMYLMNTKKYYDLASVVVTEGENEFLYKYLKKHSEKISTKDFINVIDCLSSDYLKLVLENMELFNDKVSFDIVLREKSIMNKIKHVDQLVYVEFFVRLNIKNMDKIVRLYENINDEKIRCKICELMRNCLEECPRRVEIALDLAKAQSKDQIIPLEELQTLILNSNYERCIYELSFVNGTDKTKILLKLFELKDDFSYSGKRYFIYGVSDLKPQMMFDAKWIKMCKEIHSINDGRIEEDCLLNAYYATINYINRHPEMEESEKINNLYVDDKDFEPISCCLNKKM